MEIERQIRQRLERAVERESKQSDVMGYFVFTAMHPWWFKIYTTTGRSDFFIEIIWIISSTAINHMQLTDIKEAVDGHATN